MARESDLVRKLLALHAERRFVEMEKGARKALRGDPDSMLLNELAGVALAAQSRDAEALPFLERAARRGPGDAQIWENLGLCLLRLNEPARAAESLERALALRPSAVAAQALATALARLGHKDRARVVLDRAIAAHPRDAGLHRALAGLITNTAGAAAAEAAFACAAALDAADWRSRLALAQLRLQRGERREAGTLAAESLAILGPVREAPAETLATWDEIASVLYRSGRVDEALTVCRATYDIAPSPVRALATNLIAREACDWDFAARLEPAARQLLERPDGIAASSPWLLLALQRLSAEEQLTLTQSFVAAAYGDTPPRRPALVSPRARIRLGYLSADFYNHPTSVLLAGVIENHDRSRFELLACDLSPPVRDHYRLRLEAAFDKFVSLRELGDTEASAAIAREEIDIIIDLNGWTLGGRPGLLAPRPAAVQMQWLGYAGTLGAPWIDYIVADATVVPPGDDRFYTEKVIRLPETYQPNDRPEPPGRVPARAELGLPEQGMVLCCFNQMFKITAEVFALWMRILRRTPDAVLWLLAPGDGVQERLRQAARRHGVAPERLIFAPKVERDAHMARLKLVDLALDCLPYGSHTTAADAIRAGVPLIALQGETFAARVSASIVRAAGLPELIASDPQTYEDLVCRILADPVARSALRGRVTAARQTSILFDPARFARQLEQALGAAYERARSGLPPEAIDLRTAGG